MKFNGTTGQLDAVVDLSGFVPYTGASADVDLGARNFLTTGTLGAGAITGTSLTDSGMTIAGFVKNNASGLLSGGNSIVIGDIGSLLSGVSPISYNSGTGAISFLFNTNNIWTGTNQFARTGIGLAPVSTMILNVLGNAGTSGVSGDGINLKCANGFAGNHTTTSGGGTFTMVAGDGGTVTDAGGLPLIGGIAGAYSMTAGKSGNVVNTGSISTTFLSSQAGGAFNFTAGASGTINGGSDTSSNIIGISSGAGGSMTVAGGASGNVTNAYKGAAGAGGGMTLQAGSAGSWTGVMGAVAQTIVQGAGGSVSLSAGTGGAIGAASYTQGSYTSGAGGDFAVTAGSAGNPYGIGSGTATFATGRGGNVNISAGNAQIAGSVASGQAGHIILRHGNNGTGATAGKIIFRDAVTTNDILNAWYDAATSTQIVWLPQDNEKLYFGAFKSSVMYYDGTTFNIKSNNTTASDRLRLIGGTDATAGILFTINLTDQLGLIANYLYPTTNGALTLGALSNFFKDVRSRLFTFETNCTASTTGIVYYGSHRFIHNFTGPNTALSDAKNTFVGVDSGNFTMDGDGGEDPEWATENTGIGWNALKNLTTGNKNVCIGAGVGAAFTSANENVCIGSDCVKTSTDALRLVAIGFQAAMNISSAGSVVAIGAYCLDALTSGGSSTGVGYNCLTSVTTSTENTGFGNQCLQFTTGAGNTAIGNLAGFQNTSGATNTAIGNRALFSGSTGSGNVGLGYFAGGYETGSNAFYVDNQNRATTAGDKAGALIYGVFNASAASQSIKFNAGSVYLGGLDASIAYWGTGNDATIQYDGTNWLMNCGIVAPSDLKLTCGAQKTLELQNTVWKDLWTCVDPSRVSGTTNTVMVGNIRELVFSNNDTADFPSIELQHDWKEGTDLSVHLHFATRGTNASAYHVRYTLEYSWSDINGVFPSTTTLDLETTIAGGTTTLTHKLVTLGTISGGGKHIGSQLKMLLTKIASVSSDAPAANNPYVLQLGIHYETDTLGSRQITAK